MPTMIAEFVVRVAMDLNEEEDISQFLIDAAQKPGPFLVANLPQPHTAVKLIRSGSKGNYRYTDPVLAKASRRRAWKAIRGNASDPDQSTLETAILAGFAAAVGDDTAASEAEKRVEAETAAAAAEADTGSTIEEIAADAAAAAEQVGSEPEPQPAA